MNDSELPDFFRVRQRLPSMAIPDIPEAVNGALSEVPWGEKIRPGQRVGIAVGSRGINNLRQIVEEVVAAVRAQGADPVIVPAMGSHGGATPEGQTKVLAGYGIEAEPLGCPIDPAMETTVVGHTPAGLPVHFARSCQSLDHVVLVNRVKPHTRLVGDVQSGLCKMLLIGLGKQRGASVYHRVFPTVDYRFSDIARDVVELLVREMPISFGLAIVEDAYEQTSLIEAIRPEAFLSREAELLRLAAERMPRLPFDRGDLLIIDRIGKEISGTGMDTNVVGRKENDKTAQPEEFPKIRQIYVRSLTEQTAGNASGIGIAEYCHTRVLQQMNVETTRINCLTSNHVTAAAIPVHFDTDREVLQVAMTQGTGAGPGEVRWMWIPDTLQLAEVACSRGFWDEARGRDDLDILSEPQPLVFDAAGDLQPLSR